MEDGKFHPNDKVSYAVLAQVLSNLIEDYDSQNWDVKGDDIEPWYYAPMRFACHYELISADKSGKEFVTKREAILAFYRLGLRTEAITANSLRECDIDDSQMYDDQKNALTWAIKNSILLGDGRGDYQLDDGLTRAQLSVLVDRIWGFMEDHRKIIRLFFLDESSMKYVEFQDGNTGEKYLYDDPEIIQKVADSLNGFRCDRQSKVTGGGWAYAVRISDSDASSGPAYEIDCHSITIGGYIYSSEKLIFSKEWLDKMIKKQM